MLDNYVLVLLKSELWENPLYRNDHFSKKKSFSECIGHIKIPRQRFSKQPFKVLTNKFWSYEDVWGIQKITLYVLTIFLWSKNGTWVKSRANGFKNTIDTYKVIFRNNQKVFWENFASTTSLDMLLQDLCLRFLIEFSQKLFHLRPYHNKFHLWVEQNVRKWVAIQDGPWPMTSYEKSFTDTIGIRKSNQIFPRRSPSGDIPISIGEIPKISLFQSISTRKYSKWGEAAGRREYMSARKIKWKRCTHLKKTWKLK